MYFFSPQKVKFKGLYFTTCILYKLRVQFHLDLWVVIHTEHSFLLVFDTVIWNCVSWMLLKQSSPCSYTKLY